MAREKVGDLAREKVLYHVAASIKLYILTYSETYNRGLHQCESQILSEGLARKLIIITGVNGLIILTGKILARTQRTQTSLRRLQDVLKRSRGVATKQDVVTTSEKRRRIYDVLKTSDLRRLKDVQLRTSWGRQIYDVLRTSDLRRLEDV